MLRMTYLHINKGQNRSRLFVRERVELLIELSGRWLRTTLASLPLPLAHFFRSLTVDLVCTIDWDSGIPNTTILARWAQSSPSMALDFGWGAVSVWVGSSSWAEADFGTLFMLFSNSMRPRLTSFCRFSVFSDKFEISTPTDRAGIDGGNWSKLSAS